MTSAPSLLDLRWMSTPSGVGRVGQHIVAGLRELPDPGFELLLWGDPAAIGSHPQWCRVAPNRHIGNERLGQRDVLKIPRHRGGLYLQQMRPLRDWQSATIIHDTIQLRIEGSPVLARLRRLFLERVATRSHTVLTVSQHARDAIERDLGRHAADIAVLRLPMDRALADAVRRRRAELRAGNDGWRPSEVLFVGRMDPNKNLIGLFDAVVSASSPVSLHVFGARTHERAEVVRAAAGAGVTDIEVAIDTSDDALVDAYASARLVVLPSYEEGWGLPVWEAIACGIPVLASDGGSLPELAEHATAPFRNVAVSNGMEPFAVALDAQLAQPAPDPDQMTEWSELALAGAPTQAELAADVLAAISRTR